MPSPFLPPPADLNPEHRPDWSRRLRTAEQVLASLASTEAPPDPAVVAHLQGYIAGRLTLGQTLARLVDYLAIPPGQ